MKKNGEKKNHWRIFVQQRNNTSLKNPCLFEASIKTFGLIFQVFSSLSSLGELSREFGDKTDGQRDGNLNFMSQFTSHFSARFKVCDRKLPRICEHRNKRQVITVTQAVGNARTTNCGSKPFNPQANRRKECSYNIISQYFSRLYRIITQFNNSLIFVLLPPGFFRKFWL